MPALDSEAEFWYIAGLAQKAGVLSHTEVNVIRQPGRKANYWGRHLRNLKEYTKEKVMKLSNRTPEMDELLKLC